MKRKEKSKKTVIGHMQNRSVMTIFLLPAEVYYNIDKVYSKITTVSF
jgi:hypothetical protein